MGSYQVPRDTKLFLLDCQRWDWERTMAFRYREIRREGVICAAEAYAQARREIVEREIDLEEARRNPVARRRYELEEARRNPRPGRRSNRRARKIR